MMTYCALATLYLAYLGFTGYFGVLLWPVFILRVILDSASGSRSHAAATRPRYLTGNRSATEARNCQSAVPVGRIAL
jgi:hypothetical protein